MGGLLRNLVLQFNSEVRPRWFWPMAWESIPRPSWSNYIGGVRPDLILFADAASEKIETYGYLPLTLSLLRWVGFPPVTVVRYRVRDFKYYPPYSGAR